MKTNDLEERVINFTMFMIDTLKDVKKAYVSNYYGNKLLCSFGFPGFNYGEARSVESYNDFIHKMGICLKELRESYKWLKIMFKVNLYSGNKEKITKAIDENNQLISIFVESIKTSKNNNSKTVNR
ncbi:hypothetical protein MHTCC0001_26850 [Flavobacteriaceae bacterium MHTCC 0001]